MKSLLITESEKNRILNMHKSRNYLIEQDGQPRPKRLDKNYFKTEAPTGTIVLGQDGIESANGLPAYMNGSALFNGGAAFDNVGGWSSDMAGTYNYTYTEPWDRNGLDVSAIVFKCKDSNGTEQECAYWWRM
jgi:hypothetical protein